MISTLTLQDEDDDDILGFWTLHCQTYPILSSIVRDIFAIPASNTTVERLFSISKNTVTNKRTRLGTEKIDKMLFLRKNLNVLKTLFDSDSNKSERTTEKRKHDQPSNQSHDESLKKTRTYENDDVLIQEKENIF